MYIVYIIQSDKTNRFYVGYTSNLETRIIYHNSGSNRSTRNKGIWKLVYREEFKSKTEAIKRENFLKRQKNSQFYNRLIAGQ